MDSHAGSMLMKPISSGPITTCPHEFHKVAKFHLSLTTLGMRTTQPRTRNELGVILKTVNLGLSIAMAMSP